MKYYILMKMNYSYIKQMEKVKNILLDKRTKKKTGYTKNSLHKMFNNRHC